MLRIYPVLLDLVRTVRPLLKELNRHDPDLARQCRKALGSAPLNLAVGSYNRGGIARRDTTPRSARCARCSPASRWPRLSATSPRSNRGSGAGSITSSVRWCASSAATERPDGGAGSRRLRLEACSPRLQLRARRSYSGTCGDPAELRVGLLLISRRRR